MAAVEHTFHGTWEIVSCTFEGKKEISGLEGIKFRLDDTSDITWYNDLVSPLPESKDCGSCCDSASVLFSCETFEVNENNPRLIFGAFAGHSIEFNTTTLTPSDTLILFCENWYAVECKRLKEGQAAGQEKEFSFGEALSDSYFSDVIIKSSDGCEYHVHAAILRLNGFDCSMCVHHSSTISIPQTVSRTQDTLMVKAKENASVPNSPNPIKISVTLPHTSSTQATLEAHHQKSLPRLNLSPIYLQPPTEHAVLGGGGGTTGMKSQQQQQHHHQLSSSFNCLSTKPQQNGSSLNLLNIEGGMRRFPPTSHSDSHLENHNLQPQPKNIFNFCQDVMLQQTSEVCSSSSCNTRRPPLSPFRARSPSPFPSSMDTPPSSPLTPVGVLYDLPAFLLTPILHWLYTESLMPDMNEDVCEKLINFAEAQPSLMKLAEPAKKYLKMIKLKKFVVNIIMDLHSILNRVIQTINPVTISHEPALLYATFKDSLRECSIGCAKILQFCNIFIKDAADIARYQKNEIIKYVRTRIPIFMSQLHQLLRNILNVFLSLTPEEKDELANYLVPEIEKTLLILTSVIEEIKNSLEKMCKDLKCSHLDLSMKYATDDAVAMQIQNNTFITANNPMEDATVTTLFSQPPLSPRPRRGPPIGLTLYENPSDKQRLMSAENDLKFVLYMYEVRKMRDIYGRISAALDIIRDKKITYCEMDFLCKHSTINQNLEQLILDIPTYILIMENLLDRLEEKLGWKEFKFCFKLATSQINGVIVKVFDHKSALKDAMSQICKLVQKQEFTHTLIELGLLEPSNILESELNTLQSEDTFELSLDPLLMERTQDHDYNSIKLNLIRHLCEPPIAASSNLSKNALRLLHSAQLSDMEFEVHMYSPQPAQSTVPHISVMDKNSMDIQLMSSHKSSIQVHNFRAHRVIVAARCEWFKKALMSGMQESLTRKIVVTDCSPVIFRRLLLYLYGAPIDKTVGAEQICELMLLADKYSIEDLKELCENTLNSQIDEHSVLCLLGIADHYMASALKSKCLSFLSQNSHLTKAAMFKELSRPLQLEVMDLIHWYGRVSEPWSDAGGFKPRSTSRHSLKSPSKPRSRSRKSSPSFM
uniref:BTB domain-containing protein n=1 Tax=Stomoxys calcitrans TaxID=35570 RepID=A0A1I8PSK8_STOCA